MFICLDSEFQVLRGYAGQRGMRSMSLTGAWIGMSKTRAVYSVFLDNSMGQARASWGGL